MKAKRTVALLALAALWGGLIPRHVVAAAEDGHEYPSIQISGD